MKRYELRHFSPYPGGQYDAMVEDEDGEYVMHADAQAEIARLRQELDAACNAEELRQVRSDRNRLRAEIKRLRAENDRFRKIVVAAIQARDGFMPATHTTMHLANALDGLTLDDVEQPTAPDQRGE